MSKLMYLLAGLATAALIFFGTFARADEPKRDCHLSAGFGLIQLPCSGDYEYIQPDGDDTQAPMGTVIDRTPPTNDKPKGKPDGKPDGKGKGKGKGDASRNSGEDRTGRGDNGRGNGQGRR